VWLLGVGQGQRLLNRPDGSFSATLGPEKTTFDLYVQDDGSLAGGFRDLQVIATLEGGEEYTFRLGMPPSHEDERGRRGQITEAGDVDQKVQASCAALAVVHNQDNGHQFEFRVRAKPSVTITAFQLGGDPGTAITPNLKAAVAWGTSPKNKDESDYDKYKGYENCFWLPVYDAGGTPLNSEEKRMIDQQELGSEERIFHFYTRYNTPLGPENNLWLGVHSFDQGWEPDTGWRGVTTNGKPNAVGEPAVGWRFFPVTFASLTLDQEQYSPHSQMKTTCRTPANLANDCRLQWVSLPEEAVGPAISIGDAALIDGMAVKEATRTAPDTEGLYEMRLVHGVEILTRCRFSVVKGPLPPSPDIRPTLKLDKEKYSAGAPMEITCEVPPNLAEGWAVDWVLLPGETSAGPTTGIGKVPVVNGKAVKKLTQNAPGDEGQYELRLVYLGQVHTSRRFSVVKSTPPPPEGQPTLTLVGNTKTFAPGAAVRVAFTVAEVDANAGFVAVVPSQPRQIRELGSKTAGTLSFVAPTAAGNYELRMLLPNGTVLCTEPLTVAPDQPLSDDDSIIRQLRKARYSMHHPYKGKSAKLGCQTQEGHRHAIVVQSPGETFNVYGGQYTGKEHLVVFAPDGKIHRALPNPKNPNELRVPEFTVTKIGHLEIGILGDEPGRFNVVCETKPGTSYCTRLKTKLRWTGWGWDGVIKHRLAPNEAAWFGIQAKNFRDKILLRDGGLDLDIRGYCYDRDGVNHPDRFRRPPAGIIFRQQPLGDCDVFDVIGYGDSTAMSDLPIHLYAPNGHAGGEIVMRVVDCRRAAAPGIDDLLEFGRPQ
jgi:hypothetical protein